MEIKPFSEDISYGQEDGSIFQELRFSPVEDYKRLFNFEIWKKVEPKYNLESMGNVINAVKDRTMTLNFRIGPETGNWFISEKLFNDTQKTLREYISKEKLTPSETTRAKKLLKVTYPKSLPAPIQKAIATSAAKEIAKRKSIKLSAKLLAKWTGKLVPIVALGITLADLVKRGMKELDKDEKSESNTIPFGEYYHKDKGWY